MRIVTMVGKGKISIVTILDDGKGRIRQDQGKIKARYNKGHGEYGW